MQHDQGHEQVAVGANVGHVLEAAAAEVLDVIGAGPETPAVTATPTPTTPTVQKKDLCMAAIRTDKAIEVGKMTVPATARQSGVIVVGLHPKSSDGTRASMILGCTARFWVLNPFTLEGGKIKQRGSLTTVDKVRLECPECGRTCSMHYYELRRVGKRTDSKKSVAVYCRDCRVLKDKMVPMTQLNIRPRLLPADGATSEPIFNSIDDSEMGPLLQSWGQFGKDRQELVLPRIWAVYERGTAPTDVTGWQPEDEKADTIDQRLREQRCTIRPVDIACKSETGAIKALIMEAQAGWATGWAAESELRETHHYGFKRRFVGSPKQDQRRKAQHDRHAHRQQFAV